MCTNKKLAAGEPNHISKCHSLQGVEGVVRLIRAQLLIANFLADVSVGRLQGAATANSLSDIFLGRLQGAATAPVLACVSVGRLQGAATANFLADVSVGR